MWISVKHSRVSYRGEMGWNNDQDSKEIMIHERVSTLKNIESLGAIKYEKYENEKELEIC